VIRGRAVAVELAAGEPFQEAVHEVARDDPLATQRDEPLQGIAQRDHRAERQQPDHRVDTRRRGYK